MHSNSITALIPTYNRKERLLNTLFSLQNQTDNDFEVVLLDNASDYDVEDVISKLRPEFAKKISFYRNHYNIGLSGNVASIFLFCKTEWAWLLSDDDKPNEQAIELIKKSINDNPEASIFHFSLFDYLSESYKEFSTLDGFVTFYNFLIKKANPQTRNSLKGDFIFISNKIFNVKKIGNLFNFMFDCAGTYIPHALTIVKFLDEKRGNVIFVSKRIVEFYPNEGSHWNIEKVTRGISSLGLISFDSISKRQRKRLLRFLMFDYTYVLSRYIESEKRNPQFLKDVYRATFSIFLNFKEKFVYKVFLLMSKSNFSFNMLKSFYYKVRKKGK